VYGQVTKREQFSKKACEFFAPACMMESGGSSLRDRLLAGLLLAAAVLVYGNTLVNQFVLDDELYITRNAQVVDPTLRNLFSANPYSNVFRPVTFATLALNWEIQGANPISYHLVNLLLHACVSWLLYILLQELLGSYPEAKTIAFVAALLYAVHPIHTEAVAWAVGRAELLAAGFLFAGWILHLQDQTFGSLVCFALAMLSKESAVAFFPLVLLGDYATGKWKPRLRYALAGGLGLLYLGVLRKVQGGHFGQNGISMIDNPLASLPAGWRVLNALRVAWKYAALQVYPAMLSSDYSFNQIPIFRDWRHTLPAALAAVAVAGLWIWALRKRRTGWILAGAIYFAGFATTANILMPTGTIMGERLAYLPSAGFCLALALAWQWLQRKQQKVAWGALAVIVLALSVRTVVRNRDWKDPFALFTADARAVPNDAKIHANLAGQYLLRRQMDLAATEYQAALRIEPDFADSLASYSAIEFERGNVASARAMIERALSLSDRNDLKYDFMSVLYADILMKSNQHDKALQVLNGQIKESPMYSPAWSTRAELHCERGELAAGRSDAQMSLRLNPEDRQARHLLQWLDAKASVPSSPQQ
jgi:protein O-mannosyl-transferase